MLSRLIFANQTRNGRLIDFRHDHSAKVVRQWREFLSVLIFCILLATTLFAISSTEAAAATTLTTCTDLTTQKTVILKANQKSCKPLHATANWHIVPSDSSAHSGAGYASLRTCTSKRPQFDYQLLKRKCAKYQNTNDYWRTVTSLETPIIASANARGYDSAAFALAATTQNIDAPIAYYLITNIKSGRINKVSPNNFGELSISNLSPLSSYTFTITAVSVDGTSLSSSITPVITTGAVPVVAPAPAPLAAPAFTLSASSETGTVNTAATGFTILSTGGAIANFAISATPPGMNFNTTTGALTGTPNTVASATSYTVTATNASASSTRTFTFTVTATCANGGTCIVGDRGPGGGTIFYVANTPFACGPTRLMTCTYLETAPSGWNTGSDPRRYWARGNQRVVNNGSSPETATATAIGWGYFNTRAIINQGNIDPTLDAAALADSHTVTVAGVVYDDWYLPSSDELNEMCKWARGQAWISDETECNASGSINSATYGAATAGFISDGAEFISAWTDGTYWSSSEVAELYGEVQRFYSGVSYGEQKSVYLRYVRPVRAF
jgi:hypothetical protein